MTRRSRYRNQLTRRAAIPLAACVILILGFTCVMMQSTVWNRTAAPAAEPLFYTTLPGVDLSATQAAKRPELLKQLNRQRCPCDCMRTVAGCRNHHGTCTFSLAVAREAAAAAR